MFSRFTLFVFRQASIAFKLQIRTRSSLPQLAWWLCQRRTATRCESPRGMHDAGLGIFYRKASYILAFAVFSLNTSDCLSCERITVPGRAKNFVIRAEQNGRVMKHAGLQAVVSGCGFMLSHPPSTNPARFNFRHPLDLISVPK